jgi:hypothetical protein
MNTSKIVKFLKNDVCFRFLMVIVILIAYVPGFVGLIINTTAIDSYTDDVRQQIWPMFRYVDPTLFPGDYIADYFSDCLPVGFKAVYWLGAFVVHPRTLSKILFYLLYGVLLGNMALVGKKLAGEKGAWVAVLLTLGNGFLVERMMGGLPRSFSFPLVSLLFLGLVYARPWVLFSVVVLSALFYPIICAIAGPAMFIYMIILPERFRGLSERWSFPKRLSLIAAGAVLCCLFVIPVFHATQKYGRKLSPKDIKQFPEYGPGGRYNVFDGYPYEEYWRASLIVSRFSTKSGYKNTWPVIGDVLHRKHPQYLGMSYASIVYAIVLYSTLVICLAQSHKQPENLRVMTIWLLSVVMYYLSQWVLPYLYLPPRYVEFIHPLLFVFQVCVTWRFFCECLANSSENEKYIRKKVIGGVGVVCCILVFVVVLRPSDSEAGLIKKIKSNRNVVRFISSLDKDVLIAGWPTRLLSDVPYLVERSVFGGHEMHVVIHSGYTLKMRDRVYDTIKALWPETSRDIVNLNNKWGVTHLLLDKYLYRRNTIYKYFNPFNDLIKKRIVKVNLINEFRKRWPEAIVYDDGDYVLVDLIKLENILEPKLGEGSQSGKNNN